MDNINNGFKMAGQMFGINTAADVANLVARAFAPQKTIMKKEDPEPLPTRYSDSIVEQSAKDESPFNPALMLTSVLKLLGFDNAKLGAIALNAIIMIAQMIGKALTTPRSPVTQIPENDPYANFEKFSPNNLADLYYQSDPMQNDVHTTADDHQPRKARDESPIDMLLENPSSEFSKLLTKVRDRELPLQLTDTVTNLENAKGDYDCVKILLCKISPFIWGMQNAVKDRIEGSDTSNEESADDNRLSLFFKYLPSEREFKQHGSSCERNFTNCKFTD